MHDIGKFYQRGYSKPKCNNYTYFKDIQNRRTGAHVRWSRDYIENILEISDDRIIFPVLYHHNNYRDYVEVEEGNVQEIFFDIISKADHHSAAERFKKESGEKQDYYRTEPLVSIFSRINNDSEKRQIMVGKYSDNFDALKPEYNVSLGTDIYKRFWNKFEYESKNMGCLNFNSLLFLLKKYTSFIPSAVATSVVDISLFNHLKTTAALANCQLLYLNNNSHSNLKDNEDLYLVVEICLDNVEKFIYNINNSEKSRQDAIRLLHGRSMYVSLLLESVVSRIIIESDISQANILFQNSNRHVLVMPNTKTTRILLEKISDKINTYLIREFDCELYLSISYTKASGDDISRGFKSILENLINKKDKMNYNPFITNLEDVFKLKIPQYTDLCDICGKESKNRICYRCKKYLKLGSLNKDYIIKIESNEDYDFDLYFKSLNIGYKLTNINSFDEFKELLNRYSNCNNIEFIKINDSDNFLEYAKHNNEENVSFSFRYMANVLPRHTKESIFTFEDLSKISKGSNSIGIVNLSVDNTTELYLNGFDYLTNEKEQEGLSISRISTLSSLFDLFFKGIVNKIITENYYVYESKDEFNDDNYKTITLTKEENTFNIYKSKEKVKAKKIPTIYLNYSEDNHLLAIGAYDDIINFTSEFENKFREWTCNNNTITLSGSINIIKPKYPIDRAITKSEEDIQIVRKCEGNKIKIMNEILLWDTEEKVIGFTELLDYSNKLDEYLDNSYVSKGFLYSLLQLRNMHFNYKTPRSIDELDKQELEKQTKKGYVPLYKYKLRLIDNYNVFHELDENGLKYLPWIKFPLLFTNLKNKEGN